MATTHAPEEVADKPVRAALGPRPALEIDRLFEALVRLQGSDLHLKVGQPPYMRVKGSLQPLKAVKLDDEQMRRLCMPMLDDRQRKILEHDGGADFAYACVVDDVRWRFR
ncbi:twitching motility protein PilT, partial [bacterium]|nr:twitching motility protein PilT [bacterium]